jgi:hypothetical protein
MTSAAVRWLDGKEPEAIRFLEALVNQDSGTYDALDVNRLADMLVAPLRDLGFPVNEGRPEVSIFAAHQARGVKAPYPTNVTRVYSDGEWIAGPRLPRERSGQRERDREMERRPAALCRLDPDAAAMELDEPLADGESESCASGLAGHGTLAMVKRLE